MTARALALCALAGATLAGCGGDACAGAPQALALGWYGVKNTFNDFATSPVPLISPPQGGGAGVLTAVRARGLAAGSYHFVVDVVVDGLAVMSQGGDVNARLRCQDTWAQSPNLPILMPGTAFADLNGRTAHVDVELASADGTHAHVSASNVIAEPEGP